MRKDTNAALTSAKTVMNAIRAKQNDIIKEKKLTAVKHFDVYIIPKGTCKRNVNFINDKTTTLHQAHPDTHGKDFS